MLLLHEVGISCQEYCYYGLQGSQVCETADYFSPLILCTAPSTTMKLANREEAFSEYYL